MPEVFITVFIMYACMYRYEDWGFTTLPPAEQMAVEEYMLDYTADTDDRGIALFYDFPHDSMVYGYAQQSGLRKAQVPAVRRITGGSHIQVGPNTMAYSFAVPRNNQFADLEDMRGYYAGVVADALRSMGVPNVTVDNDASTILVNDRIIASHAINWGVDSALLHGLLLVDPYDADSVAQHLPLKTRKIGNHRYSEYDVLQHLPGLSTVIDTSEKASQERRLRLKQQTATAIKEELVQRNLPDINPVTGKTVRTSHQTQGYKHRSEAWIRDRTPAFTPERIETIPYHPLQGELEDLRDYCLFIQTDDTDFKHMAAPLP